MSATTIRRGGKPARKAKGRKRGAMAAGARANGLATSAFAALGLGEQALHRLFVGLILAVVAALGWVAAVYTGVPEMVGQRFADGAASIGFTVRRMEVRGVESMDEQEVYERIIPLRDQPMPLLDLDTLRDELIALPWVRDARVSRQLPDTLVIDIVERTPHAVLQQGEEFVLIDASGHRLEPVTAADAQKRLVLAGPGAADHALDLTELLTAAPALKPQVRGAEWIGNRRWNLTFATGQVLALPEGAENAAKALVTFARLDGMNRLLGGKVAVFDMRADDRIYMRVPGRAEEEAKLEAERKRIAAEAKRAAEGE